LASLFGLGGKAEQGGTPTPPTPGEPQPGVAPDPNGQRGNLPPGALPLGGGMGHGFNLSLNYTLSRQRPVPAPPSFGGPVTNPSSQQVTLNLNFQPTPHWSATWASNYDFVSQQFGLHVIRLERDLHRWHASFSFTKSPNGNFAFSFYVSLLDQPDIKFDYAQQSFFTR
jgi:hypothetical protein